MTGAVDQVTPDGVLMLIAPPAAPPHAAAGTNPNPENPSWFWTGFGLLVDAVNAVPGL